MFVRVPASDLRHSEKNICVRIATDAG